MQIKIYPEDIIKRCLWDSYVSYIIRSEKEASEILEKNEEIIMSEKDALVIGLLKVIETDNLIHKFNNYIAEVLTNKSVNKSALMIKKTTLESAIDSFLNKFPDYWKPDLIWSKAIEDLVQYIENIKEDISNLELHIIEDKNITIELYSSNSVKKLLKFNY